MSLVRDIRGSTISLRRSDFVLHVVFFAYAVVIATKKAFDFSDGVLDIVLLSIIIGALLVRPSRLSEGMRWVFRQRIFAMFLIFSIYYAGLSFLSYNTVGNIVIDYFSVFKWLVYFFFGCLFGYVYRISLFVEFPSVYLMSVFVLLLLIYSLLTYNWAGVGGVSTLFGFYENSFESMFSQRSVFALFAFVIFVFALNKLGGVGGKYMAYFLLGSSLVFLFMSGNRKMLIAAAVVILFMRGYGRFRNVAKLSVLLVVSVLAGFIVQSQLFDKSISEYSNPEQPRMHIYHISFQIAAERFPLGTGPATFASRGSMINYSPLYEEYGLDQRWGFREFDEVHFHNDTYWAQIIAQFGALGFLLVILVVAEMYRILGKDDLKVSDRLLLTVILLISVTTPALQRTEVALFLFFLFGARLPSKRALQRA